MVFTKSAALLALSAVVLPFASAVPAGSYPESYTTTSPAEPPAYTATSTWTSTTWATEPTTATTTWKPHHTHTKGGHGGNHFCSYQRKVAGIQQEIDTISSHSFANADRIPLAPNATRTFFVTPNELPEVTLEVNVGFDAETVRDELVLLATVLNAAVPPNSVHYIKNANGSVTSDFIQTDDFVLPYEHVREIHDFDADCQITTITGYVHGNLVCPTTGSPDVLTNPVVSELCSLAKAAGLLPDIETRRS